MAVRQVGTIAGVLVLGLLGSSLRAAEPPATRVELDARQAAIGLLHAHFNFAASGPALTLAYPKWIPGEHSPSGPLTQVVKLAFSARGRSLAWRRDPEDPFLFRVTVPEGVREVEADLDFACVLGETGFRSDICSSYDQLVVNWWTVLLYSPELPNDRNPFAATVLLPEGWQARSALPLERRDPDGRLVFATVPLKTLVDSPLIAAVHLRSVPLGGAANAQLDLSAQTAEGLEVPAPTLEHFRRLIAEAEALFGGPRYAHYELLLSLGDDIDHYTLEHLESSENRMPARGLADARLLLTSATLIPHEYLHSWNGKARTPKGLDITTYQDPMRAGLIWVYEGLTEYYAKVLAARSGFWSEEQLVDCLAIDAAQMSFHTGRLWRSLQDTTDGAQMLLTSPNAWVSARRNVDFYPESALMWLEADTLIRERSGGRHSLDDFARSFLGPSAPSTPYAFEDVVAALERVQHYDWARFLREHLESYAPEPPLQGIVRGGWRLVYSDAKSELVAGLEAVHKIDLLWPEWESWGFSDLRPGLGALLRDDGAVLDSAPGTSAYEAGILPGMRITRVNGAPFTLAAMEAAVRATRAGPGLRLEVANGVHVSTIELDYHGGLRYPHLARDTSRPDLLKLIATPRTATSGR